MSLSLTPDNSISAGNPQPRTISSEVLNSLPKLYKNLALVLIEDGEWILVDEVTG